MLYSDKLPEIHSLVCESDNEVSESESLQVEWSPKNSDSQIGSLEVAEVSEEPKRVNETSSFLSGVEALRL